MRYHVYERHWLVQLSQQLAAYMGASSCLQRAACDSPAVPFTLSKPPYQRPTPMSVSEIFFSRNSTNRSSGEAQKYKSVFCSNKKRRISAGHSISNYRHFKTVPTIDKDGTDCDDDGLKLPPPLPSHCPIHAHNGFAGISPLSQCVCKFCILWIDS